MDQDSDATTSAMEELLLIAKRAKAKKERESLGLGEVDPTIQSGSDFLFAEQDAVASIWGSGDQVIWASGEVLIVAGPPGVGKSTVVQHLALARAGIGPGEVLGYPVEPDPERRVLMLSLDRPTQIARSMRRMVSELEHGRILRDQFRVCTDLGFDIGESPNALAHLAQEQNAGTVVLDSAFCAASGLREDDKMSSAMRALRKCEANGARVVMVHHIRKQSRSDPASPQLDSMFGSAMISAAAGSVVLLKPLSRDKVLLAHRKSPMEPVPDQHFEINHDTGWLKSSRRRSALEVLALSPDEALSAREIADRASGDTSNGGVQTIRRELASLASSGRVELGGSQGQTQLWTISAIGMERVGSVVGLDGGNGISHAPSTQANTQPTDGNANRKNIELNAVSNRESDVEPKGSHIALDFGGDEGVSERREPE
jgi:replicative DNA helicase